MTRKKKKWRKRFGAILAPLQSILLWAAVGVLGRLPSRWRLPLALRVGRAASRWLPIRRRHVLEHLRLAFPDWEPEEREGLLPTIYMHLVACVLEICAMMRMKPEDILEGVEQPWSDGGWVEKFRREGQGFVIVTGHMGNWEWAGAWLTSIGVDLASVSKPQHNRAGNRMAEALRRRFNLKIFTTKDNPRHLLRHIRRGGVVALLSDQDAGRKGVFCDFFGRPASTATGAAWIAWRLGIPLLPMWGYRTAKGKLRVTADDPIWPDSRAPMEGEIERLTQYHVTSLENAIRRDPGQYFWFHRRWKTQPKIDKNPPETATA